MIESISCPSIPQLATCRPLIHLALFKWPASNLAQWCTVTCQMMFAKCPASLLGLKFSKKSCKNSNSSGSHFVKHLHQIPFN